MPRDFVIPPSTYVFIALHVKATLTTNEMWKVKEMKRLFLYAGIKEQDGGLVQSAIALNFDLKISAGFFFH